MITICGRNGERGVARSSSSSLFQSAIRCCASCRKPRSDLRESSGGSACKVALTSLVRSNLDGIAQANPVRLEIDLYAARLAGAWIIFVPGHRRTEDQDSVAILHRP